MNVSAPVALAATHNHQADELKNLLGDEMFICTHDGKTKVDFGGYALLIKLFNHNNDSLDGFHKSDVNKTTLAQSFDYFHIAQTSLIKFDYAQHIAIASARYGSLNSRAPPFIA